MVKWESNKIIINIMVEAMDNSNTHVFFTQSRKLILRGKLICPKL